MTTAPRRWTSPAPPLPVELALHKGAIWEVRRRLWNADRTAVTRYELVVPGTGFCAAHRAIDAYAAHGDHIEDLVLMSVLSSHITP